MNDRLPPFGFDSWSAHDDAVESDERAAKDAMSDGLNVGLPKGVSAVVVDPDFGWTFDITEANDDGRFLRTLRENAKVYAYQMRLRDLVEFATSYSRESAIEILNEVADLIEE